WEPPQGLAVVKLSARKPHTGGILHTKHWTAWPLIGKDRGVVWMGSTKVALRASPGRIGPCTHAQRPKRQPNLHDMAYCNNSRAKRASPCGSSLGQCSLSCTPL